MFNFTFQRQSGQIDIDFSKVEECDEKSLVVPFEINPKNASNDIVLAWDLILSQLRLHLSKTLEDEDREWFEEYSIYSKSTQTLIKTASNFTNYFEQCTNNFNNTTDAVTTPISIVIEV